MSNKIRFGILGCGVIGPYHARAIAALSNDAELVAVADHDMDRAMKLAQEYSADWYDNLQSLLAHPGLDAVCICTPSGRHAEHAIAALHSGKHVVIEKPVDITLPAIDHLLSVQRSTNRIVSVISQHRFDLATRIVADAVQQGRFGRLTVGTAQVRWWRSQDYYDSGKWRGTWALDGGGALMNQSIHTIDLLLSIMGDAVEASAYTARLAHERIEVEDTAVAVLRFANGALGVVEGTTAAYPGLTARLEIHGERGSAIIDNDQLVYFHVATPGQESGAYGAASDSNQAAEVLSMYNVETSSVMPGADPGGPSLSHRPQIQDFIAAVREGREPQVTIEEGRKAVAAILAIYESARLGQPEPIAVSPAASSIAKPVSGAIAHAKA